MSYASTAELLADLKIDLDLAPTDWTHLDGSATTTEEIDQILKSTIEDWNKFAEILQLRKVRHEVHRDVLTEVADLVAPYFDAHPEARTVADLQQHMSTEDLTRLNKLIDQEELSR